MFRRNRGGRRGWVAVLALLAGAALVGVGAATVDVGMLCASKQHVQASVDAAALSGAQHLPDSSNASNWATQCLRANRPDESWYELTVPSTDGVTVYSPREDVPGYGTLGPDMQGIKIRALGGFDYTFARILGADRAEVEASATAIRKAREAWRGIFVEDHASIQNATVEITGYLHANDRITFDTSDGFINGETTFVNYLTLTNSNVNLQGGANSTAVCSRPTACYASDFDVDYDIMAGDDPPITGASTCWADITADGSSEVWFPPGVYECDDLILHDCGTVAGDHVTFLVHDEVQIYNNDTVQLSAKQHDILIYVMGNDTDALRLIASPAIEVTGGICVPNGGIYMKNAELQVTDGLIYSKDLYIDQAATVANLRSDTRITEIVQLVQ